jgi:uncharacterized membrane protein YidH (DUF202 family)
MDVIVDSQYGGPYGTTSRPGSSRASSIKKGFGFKGLGGVFKKSKGSRETSPLLGPTQTDDIVPQIRIIPPKPKKVVGVLKVEAKVFFANERTFLKWMNFAVMLGTLGVGLFNAGDNIGRFAGILLAITALLTLVYSIWLYERRLTMLRNKDPGPYGKLCAVVCVDNLLRLWTIPDRLFFFLCLHIRRARYAHFDVRLHADSHLSQLLPEV